MPPNQDTRPTFSFGAACHTLPHGHATCAAGVGQPLLRQGYSQWQRILWAQIRRVFLSLSISLMLSLLKDASGTMLNSSCPKFRLLSNYFTFQFTLRGKPVAAHVSLCAEGSFRGRQKRDCLAARKEIAQTLLKQGPCFDMVPWVS